jgi:uncharacterized CHY-type Zn-finger protein
MFEGIEFKLGESRYTYKCGVCGKKLTTHEYDHRKICLNCGTNINIVDPIVIENI